MNSQVELLSRVPVHTPLGRGRVVYEFADGQVAVELEGGGGHLFLRTQLFPAGRPPLAGAGRREVHSR